MCIVNWRTCGGCSRMCRPRIKSAIEMMPPHTHHRTAFTLAEIVIAMGVTGVIALALGSLASAVHSSNQYVQQQATMTQHARVVLERIKRHVETAHTSREFPGFVIIERSSSGHDFPDAIAIWQPVSAAANPDGLPLVSELIVYLPNPASPNELWEITDRTNHAAAPAVAATSSWQTLLKSLAASSSATRVAVTELLRRAKANASDTQLWAVIRFEGNQYPTDARLADHLAGSANWEDLEWAQSLYSNQSGMRQSWCRIEMQLIPRELAAADGQDSADVSTPYFGSAAIYYEVEP